MQDFDSDIRALKREWLVTRLVVILGFVVALAAAGYAGVVLRLQVLNTREAVAKQQAEINTPVTAPADVAAFCPLAVNNAKKMGLIPGYADATSPAPHATQMKGRYLCSAATQSSQFVVAADFVCKNLKDSRCVSVYAVTQNGKTIIYTRKDD